MTIAELFVNLGVKGDGQAKSALGGVKEGLGDIKSMSIEAKAAILAVVYGLQRMMSESGKHGQGLANFAAQTGLSAQMLQKWQYAGQQVAVANEEVASSFKTVQDAMAQMQLGGAAPQGWAVINSHLEKMNEGIDPKRINDIEYVMQKLQRFAQTSNQAFGNQMLKGLVGDNMIGAFRRNAFNDKIFSQAPTYSDGQIKQLGRVDAAWANLGTKLNMAFGKLTAKHGLDFIKDIDMIATKVLKLSDALLILAERSKVFEGIGKVFEGWGFMLDSINMSLAENAKLENMSKDDKQKYLAKKWADRKYQDEQESLYIKDQIIGFFGGKQRHEKIMDARPVSKIKGNGMSVVNNNNNTMTFVFDENTAKDPQSIANAVDKKVKEANVNSPKNGGY